MSAALRSYHAFISKDHLTSFKLCEELRAHGPMGSLAERLFRWLRADTGKRDLGETTAELRGAKISSYTVLLEWLMAVAVEESVRWGIVRADRCVIIELPGMGQIRLPCAVGYGVLPIYRKRWDGKNVNAERILGFCEAVLDGVYPGASQKGETKWTPENVNVGHSSDLRPADSPNL